MRQTVECGSDELSRVPSPVTWADVERRAADAALDAHRPADPGHERQRPWSTLRRSAAALVAAAAVTVGVLVWRFDRPAQNVRTGPGPASTSPLAPSSSSSGPLTTIPTITTIPPTVTTVPTTQTSRTSAVTALTGSDYLVWGGEDGTDETDRNDGFAMDLDSGAVTAIPPAPIRRSGGTQGAWTGTELVVWSAHAPGCGACDGLTPQAAAWNPRTKTWRAIAAPPLVAVTDTQAAVWTGALVVTVTSGGAAAAYDPAADRWITIATVQARASGRASLVWTGSEVVYWAPASFAGPFPSPIGRPVADRGWRWAPGRDAWEPLPNLPDGHRTQLASAVWTGSDVVVWGAATGGDSAKDIAVGARWRPGDETWKAMAPSPQGAGRGYVGTAGSQGLAVDRATGLVVVTPIDLGDGATTPTAMVYEPRSDTWVVTKVVLQYHAGFAVADGQVLVPDATAPIAGRLQP